MLFLEIWSSGVFFVHAYHIKHFEVSSPAVSSSHAVKIVLNKKSDSTQVTIHPFNIDAQSFRKTNNENLPRWEIGVTSQPVQANLPMVGRSAGIGWLVTPVSSVREFPFLVFLNT